MKKQIFLLIAIANVLIAYSQVFTPYDTLKGSIETSYFNGKPSIIKTYCDTINPKECFKIMEENKKIYQLISKNTEVECKFYFYTNSKIMFYAEFKNNAVNGQLIWFNKTGIIEMIAKYRDSKLIGIIYYRKKSSMEKYLKLFGETAPVSSTAEIKNY